MILAKIYIVYSTPGNFSSISQLISLPESVMETFKVVLTFEPVDDKR